MLQRGYSIGEVHRLYIEAGADIIETNTFNLKGYDDSLAQTRIARAVADEASRKVYVAGSMGPGSKMLSLSDDAAHPEARPASFEDLAAVYRENALGIIDGGADIILLETCFDALNAKAALYAITGIFEERGVRLPIMVSATINDRGGHLLTGMAVEEFYEIVSAYDIWSFGLNCSFGAPDMAPVVERLAQRVGCRVSMHPNAGLPDGAGGYDQTPEQMAQVVGCLARKGCLNIAGGCCGTTPEHIALLKKTLEGVRPRGIQPRAEAGERYFINVGERTNVAGSRKFARLISEGSYEEASALARKQVEDGATVIDINMDDPLLDAPLEMEKFVRYISNDTEIASAAFMIDSSSWDVVLKGLQNAPGRVYVNSISLKEGESEFLRKASVIARYGASVVVMAFDEDGQATTYERKIEICSRAYKLLTEKVGLSPERIIFDNNILTVGTGIAEHADYAVDFIKAVKWEKANLPGALTSGGVSNLSFAFRGNNTVREAMHSVFLYHAVQAGLDMAIVNPSMLGPYNEIEPQLLRAVEDVVLNSDPDATERLVAIADRYKDAPAGAANTTSCPAPTGHLTVEERLRHSIVTGSEAGLEHDLKEALGSHTPLDIVENILLGGMEEVGAMFAEGKMFLPQVVKTARTMKKAVDILEPYISKSDGEARQSRRKKIVLATVKGDVHDIGKNILGIVLSCNGLQVKDLGVMVDNRTIMEAIESENPDYVGVSGLITPSLGEMESLAAMMQASGLKIPLFVGGATTSALHTALALAPLYDGGVVHTGSASDCAQAIIRLDKDPEAAMAQIKDSQKRLVELHNSSKETFASIEQAREKAPEHTNYNPDFKEDIFINNLPIKDLEPYIDWRMFLSFWGFKEDSSKEAQKCLAEGRVALSKMTDVKISLSAKFFEAEKRNPKDETIILGGESFNLGRSTSSLTKYESYADFISIGASAGVFAIKVEDSHKDDLMRRSLCARLAAAASDYLTNKMPDNTIAPAFGYPSLPDHSLKVQAFRLLDAENLLGLRLTDSYAMIPETSVCGMLICHPEAKYINFRSK